MEPVNPLDILALPAKQARFVDFIFLQCFFQCWCTHSLVQHEILCHMHPSGRADI